MKITITDALLKAQEAQEQADIATDPVEANRFHVFAESLELGAQEAQKNGQTEFELTDTLATLADEDRAHFQALIDKAT